jgi:hypothetical protein
VITLKGGLESGLLTRIMLYGRRHSESEVRKPEGLPMHVRFLFYEDCPSHEPALERLRGVLAEGDIDADVEVVEIESEEQARGLRFVGSPTILVNGWDIDLPPPDSHHGLTCRAYRLEDGRISPLPSRGMIRRAIDAAAKAEPADGPAGSGRSI